MRGEHRCAADAGEPGQSTLRDTWTSALLVITVLGAPCPWATAAFTLTGVVGCSALPGNGEALLHWI